MFGRGGMSSVSSRKFFFRTIDFIAENSWRSETWSTSEAAEDAEILHQIKAEEKIRYSTMV